ncbi:MAG TPA: gamma-glutamylcyclotransferase [Burkholderiaceae bacterium]|nr:gamma-glutamylcyclotransferase [Burkholderiaceae bacterium]
MNPEDELPRRLGYEELEASLEGFLARWDREQPLWVFGYGSLIWRPDLSFDLRRAARVHGYHRRLCLWSRINRGTPQCPGLVAGLDRGGSCAGVVYRVPAIAVRSQFSQLWQREMMTNSYEPRTLECRLEDGALVDAVAFVVRRDAPNYAGRLEEQRILEVFARGSSGRYGSSLDYLVNTICGLRSHGITDPHLERLARHAGVDPSTWRDGAAA